jgi:transposase
LREPSDKKPGGQKGHKGETLRQVAEPDAVIEHFPSSCAECGEELTPASSTGFSARQVFDLPEPPPPVVTEHRAHVCACPHCGTKTTASFPDGCNAPVQYGPRIMAMVVYLLHYQLLPEDRLAELMATLFGVKLVPATIARMSRSCAARLQDFAATLSNLVAGAAVKHMDETGFRVGGKTQWLHVACTTLLTFYRVCAKRGSLLANVTGGIVVHDHWKPYYTMLGVLHALCNAHHLRELRALIEIEKEDWARKMHRLLRRACHAVNLARERGSPLKPRLIELFNRRYDAIAAEGMAFHEAQSPLEPAAAPEGCPKKRGRKRRRTGHNLLLRLVTRKQDVLRFLVDPRVPFTNNEAERAGRMAKVKQKISGGFRSLQGAVDFAIIRSAIGTALKQGWNVIHTLGQDSKTLTAMVRAG